MIGRWGLVAGVLLATAPALAAQCPITLTATGGGYYYVTVNGDSLSAHSTERAAAAKAISVYRQDSTKAVGYTQTYQVRVGGCAGGVRVDTVTVQLPGHVDTVYVTRPDSTPPVTPPPVDTTPPVVVPPDTTSPTPPVPGAYRFTPMSQVARWRAMRDANDPWWKEAVKWCGNTGTSAEGYGESGLWCAIVAVTNDDAGAASKAIAKLVGTKREETSGDNRREAQTELLVKRDLLDRWMTPADKATVDATLARWVEYDFATNVPQYVGGMNLGDSDQITGTGCAVVLHDLFYGTHWTDSTERSRGNRFGGMTATGTSGTVINAIAGYVQRAHGGEYVESVEYNPGTLALLAMCNTGVRAALGRDVVPGASQLVTDQGTSLAARITPDLAVETQWGDEQQPRALWRYRLPIALAMSDSPYAKWTLQQLMAAKWPSASNLMARGLLLANPATPKPFPDPFVWLADGMGMLTWRQGAALSWVQAMPLTGVDHSTQDPPFNLQVYKAGWLLTNPIGYGGYKEQRVNGPVYAGLNLFSQRKMTWADSGNGWVALAGETKGTYTLAKSPTPGEFLHYGGVVTVLTDVGGWQVAIVRDSVSMEDPRTLANYASYRNDGTYPHQRWITEFDGKFWRLWHTPVKATMQGTDLSWPVPGGTAIVKTFGASVQVTLVDESTLGWSSSSINAGEVKWQARVHADSPVMWSVWMAGSGTPPVVTQAGNAVTVGGRTCTLTSAKASCQP